MGWEINKREKNKKYILEIVNKTKYNICMMKDLHKQYSNTDRAK